MKWSSFLSFSKLLKTYSQEVSCPICFERFYMADAPFRCQSGACAKAPDPLVEELFSLDTAPQLGRVFYEKAPRLLPNIFKRHHPSPTCPCPICHTPAPLRLCPQCHGPLPTDYWQHPTYTIALVGPEKSGKTDYLNGLLDRLTAIGADAYGLSLKPAQASTSPWHPPLYRYSETNTGATKAFILFYELPAKVLLAYERLHAYYDLLSRVHGLFVFLDPATFPGIGGAKKRDTEKTVDTLTSYFRQLVRRKGRHSMPATAFILSKLDLVMNLLAPNTLLRHDTTPASGQEHHDSYQVSREVRGHLAAWAGPNLLQTIQHEYLKDPHRFFAVSSDVGKAAPQSFAPLRLEEPFLWLLKTIAGPLPERSLPIHWGHGTLKTPLSSDEKELGAPNHEATGRRHPRKNDAAIQKKPSRPG